MNSKAALGLTAGALAVGLLAGLALGGDGDKTSKVKGPGPTKTVAGVPIGYAHSQDGAVAAASAYAESIGPLALATPEARDAALAAMTDPKGRDEVRRGLEPGLEALGKGLTTPTSADAVVRSAPVGYRVGVYSEERAEVELWAVGVVGNAQSLPPSASWGITKVLLRWVDGDWKLAASVEQSEGPTPQLNGSASPPLEFAQAIRGFRSFHHAPAD